MIRIPLKLVKGGKEGDLLTQGWTKQTTIGEPRLSEIADNYRQLGYEVYIVQHSIEESGDSCNTCFSADPDNGQIAGDLYIRKDANAKPEANDELF
ncbi:MAG: hypothetical protein HHJ12_05880 [Glaciimonas sp.]|nr:hypothetical protein [Glaciimonas sp.]